VAAGTKRRRLRGAAAALAICSSAVAVACSDDEPAVGSFCDELKQAPSLASVLAGFADQDPARLDDQLDRASAEYDDLRDAAPSEIAPDVARTVDLVHDVIEAVRTDRDDPVAAAEGVRVVIADHPDAETSSLAVADYARQECGLELNPGRGADQPEGDGDDTDPTDDAGGDGPQTGGL
jgi:hypothetical protein